MATFAGAVFTGKKFTQKMGGCQSRTNTLQGSGNWFVLFISIGEAKGSEPKGEIL